MHKLQGHNLDFIEMQICTYSFPCLNILCILNATLFHPIFWVSFLCFNLKLKDKHSPRQKLRGRVNSNSK